MHYALVASYLGLRPRVVALCASTWARVASLIFWLECGREMAGGNTPRPRTIRAFGPYYAGPTGPFT